MGDPHLHVVHDRGQGVEEGPVLADQHRVGKRGGVDLVRPPDQVEPFHPPAVEAESPVRLAALRLQRGPLGLAQAQRGPVVDRRLAAGELHLSPAVELLLGLVGGIEPPLRLQLVRHGAVAVEPRRLVVLLVPGQAEPGQVGLDAPFVLGRGAGQVGVVDAQHEPSASLAREQPVGHRGADVADVQPPRGRRGEADLDGHGAGLSREAA